MKLTPPGKWILIGSEDVEVWPGHCVDGHKCVQCYFTGMKGCAPRFWLYSSRLKHQLEYPVTMMAESKFASVSLDTIALRQGGRIKTIADFQVGQPLDPIPDGGFTEEITNTVMASQPFKRRQPSRDIDHNCDNCGYPYLAHYSNPRYRKHKSHGKVVIEFVPEQYQCRRCGRLYSKDSTRLPEKAIIYLCELREQGFSCFETIELIRKAFGIKITSNTYYSNLKRRGAYTSRQGQGKRKVKDDLKSCCPG